MHFANPAQETLDAITFGVVVHATSGRIMAHNAAAARLLGLSDHELMGLTSLDPRWQAIRDDGSELPGTEHPAMVTLRTGEPVSDFERGVRRPDGSLVWLLVSSRVRKQHPREVVVTFTDYTQRHSAERALLTARAADQVMLHASNDDDLLVEICDALLSVSGQQLAWIGVAVDDEQHSVETVAASGATRYLFDGMVSWAHDDPHGKGPAGTALRERRIVTVDDVATDQHFTPWAGRAALFGLGSVVSIPFEMKRQWAVLTIYARDAGAFDERNLAVFAALGHNLERALSTLQRRQRLETAFESTVTALVTLGEFRDPYTAGHQFRVAELSVAIGEQLELDAELLWSLRLGGLVHDIGKTSLPSEILVRPGRLDPLEFSLVQRHAADGEQILRAAQLPWPIPEIAAQHHERLDGSGYPNGLRGDDICLPARIVAVADVVEAMAHHRPYREALGLEAAITEIASRSGTLFDPDVVTATCQLFDNGYTWSTPPTT